MKIVIFALATVVITTIFQGTTFAQTSAALDVIAAKYKACIKAELEAASNGDGTYDDVFFLEGKVYCDKIKGLQKRAEQAQVDIAQMTADVISGAKHELGLK